MRRRPWLVKGPIISAPGHQNSSNLQSLLETPRQWMGRKQGVKKTKRMRELTLQAGIN